MKWQRLSSDEILVVLPAVHEGDDDGILFVQLIKLCGEAAHLIAIVASSLIVEFDDRQAEFGIFEYRVGGLMPAIGRDAERKGMRRSRQWRVEGEERRGLGGRQ